jgi:hypothetical protein
VPGGIGKAKRPRAVLNGNEPVYTQPYIGLACFRCLAFPKLYCVCGDCTVLYGGYSV